MAEPDTSEGLNETGPWPKPWNQESSPGRRGQADRKEQRPCLVESACKHSGGEATEPGWANDPGPAPSDRACAQCSSALSHRDHHGTLGVSPSTNTPGSPTAAPAKSRAPRHTRQGLYLFDCVCLLSYFLFDLKVLENKNLAYFLIFWYIIGLTSTICIVQVQNIFIR